MLGSHTFLFYAFALCLSCGASSSFRAAIGAYNTTGTNLFLGFSSRRLDTKTRDSSSSNNLKNTSVEYALHSQSGPLATPTRAPLSSFSGISSGANVSNTTSELGPDVCWFLVQDKMDVRYWPDYQTRRKTKITVFATSITFFADTSTSHLRTIVSRLNTTSTIVFDQASDSLAPSCSFSNGMPTRSTELKGTISQLYGHPIKSSQAFYVYSHVTILSVPPVTNNKGRKVCVTTSTIAECNCVFPHCNKHVFANFKTPNLRYLDQKITLSTPFIYIPHNPGVSTEAFGYVPQSIIDWMVQDPKYVEKYPHLLSCQPGGPEISKLPEGIKIGFPNNRIYQGNQVHVSARDLTSSMIFTVHSDACYNPQACSTSLAPGAHAQALTPDVTRKPTIAPIPTSTSQPLDRMSTPKSTQPDQYNPPVALASVNMNPYPPVTAVPVDQGKPQPVPSYVVSLAPAASAVVVNGITSPMPGQAIAGATPIIDINSQPIKLGTVHGLAIDGQNVFAGAPTATINGVPVSLAPLATAIVVDGRTTPLTPGRTPIVSLGSQPVTASPTSQYVLGSRTLVPGAAAITVSGTPISVPTEGNAVIVGGSTVAIPNTAGPGLPVITLGDRVFTATSASQFLLGDQTLVPGAPAITVAAPASAIAAFGPSPTALTVGGKVFTPDSTAFSIDGTTISAGGPGVRVDGTPIRLGPSGILDIGGSTVSLPFNNVSPTAYTIGAQVFTPNPTAFSIDSTTISAGGPAATIDGTIVSLGPSGLLEIGSSTISLGLDAASPTLSVYTVGNQVFTPNPTAFSIDGTTILAGGPGITIDGTIISLGSSGVLDIGSSTISLAPSPTYTVGGKIFTPNPTAFSIDGTIISAGGSGVNIDGTLISLERSGTLDIGSSRVALPPSNVYTIGSETFTANPTAFSIDGTIISAGGSGVKIDGTLVSLESSGILDIGSSRILLSPSNVYSIGGETFTPNPSAFSIDGTTISAGGPEVTIDGTVISLGTSGILDIGSSAISLLSGSMDNTGNPIGLSTSIMLAEGNSITDGSSALRTTASGPGPGVTSSSTHPKSTHSGGEAHISQPRIGSLGISFIIGFVVMLR